MKALQNIQNEAQQIVEQLANRQINGMKVKYGEYPPVGNQIYCWRKS